MIDPACSTAAEGSVLTGRDGAGYCSEIRHAVGRFLCCFASARRTHPVNISASGCSKPDEVHPGKHEVCKDCKLQATCSPLYSTGDPEAASPGAIAPVQPEHADVVTQGSRQGVSLESAAVRAAKSIADRACSGGCSASMPGMPCRSAPPTACPPNATAGACGDGAPALQSVGTLRLWAQTHPDAIPAAYDPPAAVDGGECVEGGSARQHTGSTSVSAAAPQANCSWTPSAGEDEEDRRVLDDPNLRGLLQHSLHDATGATNNSTRASTGTGYHSGGPSGALVPPWGNPAAAACMAPDLRGWGSKHPSQSGAPERVLTGPAGASLPPTAAGVPQRVAAVGGRGLACSTASLNRRDSPLLVGLLTPRAARSGLSDNGSGGGTATPGLSTIRSPSAMMGLAAAGATDSTCRALVHTSSYGHGRLLGSAQAERAWGSACGQEHGSSHRLSHTGSPLPHSSRASTRPPSTSCAAYPTHHLEPANMFQRNSGPPDPVATGPDGGLPDLPPVVVVPTLRRSAMGTRTSGRASPAMHVESSWAHQEVAAAVSALAAAAASSGVRRSQTGLSQSGVAGSGLCIAIHEAGEPLDEEDQQALNSPFARSLLAHQPSFRGVSSSSPGMPCVVATPTAMLPTPGPALDAVPGLRGWGSRHASPSVPGAIRQSHNGCAAAIPQRLIAVSGSGVAGRSLTRTTASLNRRDSPLLVGLLTPRGPLGDGSEAGAPSTPDSRSCSSSGAMQAGHSLGMRLLTKTKSRGSRNGRMQQCSGSECSTPHAERATSGNREGLLW